MMYPSCTREVIKPGISKNRNRVILVQTREESGDINFTCERNKFVIFMVVI